MTEAGRGTDDHAPLGVHLGARRITGLTVKAGRVRHFRFHAGAVENCAYRLLDGGVILLMRMYVTMLP